MDTVRHLIREPLLHFLLVGAALFAGYALLNRGSRVRLSEIRVSGGQIDHLATRFSVFRQRPPTAAELKGLIDEHVREEILSREAVTLGLDRDDPIIRSRLKQKMEFIADDLTAAVEPTEAELAGYLAEHPHAFRSPTRFSFRHVYLDPGKHGGRLEADTALLLAQVKRQGSKADVTALGDSLLLPPEFAGAAESDVAAQFGPGFAEQIGRLKPGEWSGPIRSGYGLHLVLVTQRSEGRVPALNQVREAVRREWSHARRLEAKDRFYQELLRRYHVSIEWPQGAKRPEEPAEARR